MVIQMHLPIQINSIRTFSPLQPDRIIMILLSWKPMQPTLTNLRAGSFHRCSFRVTEAGLIERITDRFALEVGKDPAGIAYAKLYQKKR